jgi:hypothetical protein
VTPPPATPATAFTPQTELSPSVPKASVVVFTEPCVALTTPAAEKDNTPSISHVPAVKLILVMVFAVAFDIDVGVPLDIVALNCSPRNLLKAPGKLHPE